MDSSREAIADAVAHFLCTEYQISDQDPLFTREAHLFELGFVDSAGFVELLAFIQSQYGIELSGEHLFDGDFSSIDGISGIVASALRRDG